MIFIFQFLILNLDLFSSPSWWDESDIIAMNVVWYHQRYYDSNLRSLEHKATTINHLQAIFSEHYFFNYKPKFTIIVIWFTLRAPLYSVAFVPFTPFYTASLYYKSSKVEKKMEKKVKMEKIFFGKFRKILKNSEKIGKNQ